MTFLDKIERRFGNLAIANLTIYLLAGQIISYFFLYINSDRADLFTISSSFIANQEYWRLATFLFKPFAQSPIFVVFEWYLYYIFGMGLEKEWGAFRYTLYVLISYLCTVTAAFLFPGQILSNGYLYTSIFLAFAYLYPNFILYLIIIPVKVKWMAVVVWIGILASILFGDMSARILGIISIFNFLLFFGTSLIDRFSVEKRALVQGQKRILKPTKALHVCSVCGNNEIKDPKMVIYYCVECKPSLCYCGEHIKKHEHKIAK